jgi:hypothetical protein
MFCGRGIALDAARRKHCHLAVEFERRCASASSRRVDRRLKADHPARFSGGGYPTFLRGFADFERGPKVTTIIEETLPEVNRMAAEAIA